ncbi:MAG TPA: hypothetical protein VKA46_22915 [Gemmataceae bacterium]|nr:hypothetical protein [Gemmataceae bacterium]
MGSNTAAQAPQGRLAFGLFVAAAFLSPLLYSLCTGHVWEDYFITFKHSQNLCEGHGLVFFPGERVHGFTSPLGTLLPALCYWLSGGGSFLRALWLFRIFSAAAFAGGGAFFLQALRAGGAGKYVQLAFALLYLLDAKAVDFSGNGMETGFMLLFLGWGLSLLVRDEPRRWPAVGLCWAGLMWTRPDGCVYIAILALAGLLFANGPRLARVVAGVKSAAVCAAVYLPWFAWAWLYYGSPVPNTIRAKASCGGGYPNLSEVVRGTVERFPQRLAELFTPTYFGHGGWPAWMSVVALSLGTFCVVYWLIPIQDRLGRMVSFCFALITLYLAFLRAVPWYLPPAEVCGLLVLAQGTVACARALPRGRLAARGAVAVGLVLLIGLSAWTMLMTARQLEVQQREIEWGNRKVVAEWLKENVGEGERVYTECLGYFGYFSGVRIQDNPGLVSPEVIEEIRRGPDDFASVGLRLQPEWMAVRPFEAEGLTGREEFRTRYELVKTFDVSGRLDQYPDLLGKGYLEGDATFLIYRRVTEGAMSPDGTNAEKPDRSSQQQPLK